MAAPAITQVTPSSGPTGGRTLVNVFGSGFRLPPAPPAGGVTAKPTLSMAVTFGGAQASRVRVISESWLQCLSPISPLSDANPEGAVTLVLSNVDATGVVVPGESASRPLAFTYARPPLLGDSVLTAVVRRFMHELKRQVVPTVVKTTAFDFDPDVGDQLSLADVPALPAVIIQRVVLTHDPAYRRNVHRMVVYDVANQRTRRFRLPRVRHVTFDLILLSNQDTALSNLVEVVEDFVERNAWLFLDEAQQLLAPENRAPETMRYEMEVPRDGEFELAPRAVNTNTVYATGKVMLMGVEFDGLSSFPNDGAYEEGATLDQVVIGSEQLPDS